MRYACLVGLLFLTTAGPAAAHDLGAECKLRHGRLEVETYYDDDTPARNARVKLLDASGRAAAEGRTDAAGHWSCPAPEPGRYQVIVEDGAGHRAAIGVTVVAEPAASPGEGTTVSEGPGRAEFTRFPWLKVTIGLAILAALALSYRLARRARGTPGG